MNYAIALVLVVVGVTTVAAGWNDDPERNRKYINFINTDALHSACYYGFCECGKEPYSNHNSPIHEESCDTHRINPSLENVDTCRNSGTCMAKVDSFEHNLFGLFISKIYDRDLDDENCNFYLSTCYGLLLKDSVTLYASNNKLSYADRFLG